MVPIRMGVDHVFNGCPNQDTGRSVQHLLGVSMIPAGIHQHTLPTAIDETDIGLAPRSVGNQPGIRSGRQLVEALTETRYFTEPRQGTTRTIQPQRKHSLIDAHAVVNHALSTHWFEALCFETCCKTST